MDNKSAFVFDTNFIIQNKNIRKVIEIIGDKFSVYVTQVSIDERMSQKYIDLKNKYSKLMYFAENCKEIASIEITNSLEKQIQKEKVLTQKVYADLFGEHIIPFSSDSSIFEKILDRVYKKIPPFSSIDGASDKGFKDSLIWISLLDFFKSNGENDVVFVTNDNGFIKNDKILCNEFNEYTGKTIRIENNGYYKTLYGTKEVGFPQTKKDDSLPNVGQLREKIYKVISSLCNIEYEDSYGNPEWEKTFTLSQKVDGDYMKVIFGSLNQDINDNLFKRELPAERIFGLDKRVENRLPISMSALESALSLYEEIDSKLPEYLPQFYSAAASIVNENYVDPQMSSNNYDDIPF